MAKFSEPQQLAQSMTDPRKSADGSFMKGEETARAEFAAARTVLELHPQLRRIRGGVVALTDLQVLEAQSMAEAANAIKYFYSGDKKSKKELTAALSAQTSGGCSPDQATRILDAMYERRKVFANSMNPKEPYELKPKK